MRDSKMDYNEEQHITETIYKYSEISTNNTQYVRYRELFAREFGKSRKLPTPGPNIPSSPSTPTLQTDLMLPAYKKQFDGTTFVIAILYSWSNYIPNYYRFFISSN